MEFQKNAITKDIYKGGNQDILADEKERMNYSKNEWITFCQARSEGLKLINAKGKGVRILRGWTKQKKDTKDKKRFTGFAVVFNMDLIKEK